MFLKTIWYKPVYKKRDTSCKTNYRPASILPFVLKEEPSDTPRRSWDNSFQHQKIFLSYMKMSNSKLVQGRTMEILKRILYSKPSIS